MKKIKLFTMFVLSGILALNLFGMLKSNAASPPDHIENTAILDVTGQEITGYQGTGAVPAGFKNFGGWVYNSGTSVLTVIGSYVHNNFGYSTETGGVTASGMGGAIFAGDTAQINISATKFEANYVKAVMEATGTNRAFTWGGAISTGSGANLTVEKSIFSDNYSHSINAGTGFSNAQGGAILFNSTGTFDIKNTPFQGNCVKSEYTGSANMGVTEISAYAGGGAIANSQGSGKISNSDFLDNSAEAIAGANAQNPAQARGGAVFVYTGSNLTIANSDFIGNKARATFNGSTNVTSMPDATAQGGAIYNDGFFSTVDNSVFINNAVEASTANLAGSVALGGGAIFNDINGNLTVKNSSFKDNQINAPSGALVYGLDINNKGTAHIENSTFSGNNRTLLNDVHIDAFVSNTKDMTILNSQFSNNNITNGLIQLVVNKGSSAVLDISDSVFSDNTHTTNTTYATASNGLAFSNFAGATANIKNTLFKNNSIDHTNGGIAAGVAIYNGKVAFRSTLNIEDSDFINNSVTSSTPANSMGGAIYNYLSDLTISAVDKNVLFDGNNATYGSDIYNEGNNSATSDGVINLNAKENRSITFNGTIDGIAGNSADQIININNTPATDSGKVVFNNTVSNQTINVNGGTLQLGTMGKLAPANGFFGNNGTVGNVDLNLASGSTLSTVNSPSNGDRDDIYINNLSMDGANLMIDYGDNFNFSSLGANKTVNLTHININQEGLGMFGGGLFWGTNAETIAATINTVTFTNDSKFTFSTSTAAGRFNLFGNSTAADGLAAAVQDATTNKTFSAAPNYTLNSDLGAMAGINLVVFGNGYDITSSAKEGMIINLGQSVTVNNVGDVDNPASLGMNGFSTTVLNEGGVFTNYRGNLVVNDSVISNNTGAGAGVLYNNIESNSTFNNTVIRNNTGGDAGVLYNLATNLSSTPSVLNIINSTVLENSGETGIVINQNVNSSPTMAVVNIQDTNFINNRVTDTGGSAGTVYNHYGTMNINAINRDVIFSGNTVNNTPNDIYTIGGVLNFDAARNRTITIEGGIRGGDSVVAYPMINKNGSGALELGGDNSTVGSAGNTNKVFFNLNAGTLQMLNGSSYFGPETVTMLADNTTFSLANGSIENFNFGGGNASIASGGTVKFNLDVDFARGLTDTIDATVFDLSGRSDIVINAFHLMSDAIQPNTRFAGIFSNTIRTALAQRGGTISLGAGARHMVTPIYIYDIEYSMDDGAGIDALTFTQTKGYPGYNPALFAGAVAQQALYVQWLDIYQQAFNPMDMYMFMSKEQRQAMKFQNKLAAAKGETAFDPEMTQYNSKSVWLKPYAAFENIHLKNGPRVGNTLYGSLFGGETEMRELGHGWDGILQFYAGYNGSHQTYDGVGIYQNGGLLGATGMLYKDNFFTGLTANVGASIAQANNIYGHEDFTMLATGAAWKSGYNWELANGKFVIQPNYIMSYTFVNTFDYNNAAGISIQSDPLNAIQIEPGIRFIGNLPNGWQPYVGVSMVWNIMDKTKFQANDVALPDLSVEPFVRYGAGVRKLWGERFSGFFQAFLTNGGRNGVGLQAGFQWRL